MQETDVLGASSASARAARVPGRCSTKASRPTPTLPVDGRILCFTLGRLGRADDSCALRARLTGVLSSEELGDVFAEDDDGWLDLHGLREIGLVRGVRTERHLLRPYDVLVTARAGSIQAVLVPPDVSRTVAGIS